MHERTVTDNGLLEQRFHKLKTDYENQLIQSDQLAGENTQRNLELKKKEDDVQRLKQEIAQGTKVRDGLQKRLRLVEEQKAEVESNRERLKQQISSLERGGVIVCYILLKYPRVLALSRPGEPAKASRAGKETIRRYCEGERYAQQGIYPSIFCTLGCYQLNTVID